MKKIFLLVAFCISISLATNAQNQGKRTDRRGTSVYEKLDLTQDQKDKMRKMREDFTAQKMKIKEDKNLSKEQQRAKIKELAEKQREQRKQILTAGQQAKLAQMHEKRGGKMHNKKYAPKAGCQAQKGHRGNRKDMMKDLDLTDQQKEKIRSLNKEYKNKNKEQTAKYQNDMRAVLTPEQQAIMKEKKIKHMAKKAGVSTEGATKLQALKENFEKEKGAVERSRIAPDAQKKKMEELTAKYKEDREEIIKNYKSDTNKQNNRGKRS